MNGYPLLDREEEVYHFRKMNFLKFQAARLYERLDRSQLRRDDRRRIARLLEESLRIKNFLVRSNLRLVVSIARRFTRGNEELFERVSDGNMALMRAVDRFDYSRGHKFSTYATWAIRRACARSGLAERIQLSRFRTGIDDAVGQLPDNRSDPLWHEQIHQGHRCLLARLLERLNGRERDVISLRYGLDGQDSESQTLETIGNHLGVSKERIHQIEVQALRKLRLLASHSLSSPAGGRPPAVFSAKFPESL